MKTFLSLSVILLVNFVGSAQETLQIDFQVVFKADPPDARRAILYVDRKESVFVEDRPDEMFFSEESASDDLNGNFPEPTTGTYYKEQTSQSIESKTSLIIEISADLNPEKRERLPEDKNSPPQTAKDTLLRNTDVQQWTLQEQHKIIAGFITYKATCEYKGKKWTAWFAPDIRIASGPWKLYGLPGMILEAYDEQREVYFRATRVIDNPKEIHPRVLKFKELLTQ